jgi:hypothetical protein
MQKVVTVNISSKPDKEGAGFKKFSEYEFPILNKYLEEGYSIINVYQIAPSENVSASTITFILQK